jgi:hypothetical protein
MRPECRNSTKQDQHWGIVHASFADGIHRRRSLGLRGKTGTGAHCAYAAQEADLGVSVHEFWLRAGVDALPERRRLHRGGIVQRLRPRLRPHRRRDHHLRHAYGPRGARRVPACGRQLRDLRPVRSVLPRLPPRRWLRQTISRDGGYRDAGRIRLRRDHRDHAERRLRRGHSSRQHVYLDAGRGWRDVWARGLVVSRQQRGAQWVLGAQLRAARRAAGGAHLPGGGRLPDARQRR